MLFLWWFVGYCMALKRAFNGFKWLKSHDFKAIGESQNNAVCIYIK